MPTIVEGDFEWDEAKVRTEFSKRSVTLEGATTVFDDPRALDALDLEDPTRLVVIGISSRSRVLFVVQRVRGERARIVSAGKASPAQRRTYEEEA